MATEDLSAEQPAPPRLPDEMVTTWDDLDPDYPDLDGLGLSGSVVSLPGARSLGLLRSRLAECRLEAPAEATIEVQDAELTDLDLTGRRIESMVRVAIVGCRLGGADLGAARLRDVTISGSVLDLASLRGAELERVVIDGCRAEALDLSGARLVDVTFRGIDVSQLVLDGARLERVDVTESALDGMTEMGSLRGAVISEVQAVALARRLAEAAGVHVARWAG